MFCHSSDTKRNFLSYVKECPPYLHPIQILSSAIFLFALASSFVSNFLKFFFVLEVISPSQPAKNIVFFYTPKLSLFKDFSRRCFKMPN